MMFEDGETMEEVKEVTEMYRYSYGQQDVFMHCLRDAYNMGYLTWKDDEIRVALQSLLDRHIIYCGGPEMPFAGHTDVLLFNYCKEIFRK